MDFIGILATQGLVALAVSGSPAQMLTEYEQSTRINARTELATSTQSGQNLLNTCPNGRVEIMAPSGIELSDGTKLAMVEPFCDPDHFIVEYPNGDVQRIDVDWNEKGSKGFRSSPPTTRTEIPFFVSGDTGHVAMMTPMEDMTVEMTTEMTPSPDPIPMTMTMTTAATGGSSGSSSNTGVIIGGVVAAGAVVYFATGGAFSDLSFTPHYSFYHNDGRNSYYYGARWDYHKDNTSSYWFTGQNGSGGVLDNWRYGSGASWTNGVWKAAYNGIGDSETMDADMSLSLIKNSGVWTFNTGLGAFAHIDEVNNTDMNYFLRAQADAQYQHWTLSQAAYYNGDSGQFNLDFVRNLEK